MGLPVNELVDEEIDERRHELWISGWYLRR